MLDGLFLAAGVKSWAALVRSAKSVDIEFGTNRVAFTPTRNLGPKEGFEQLTMKVRTSPPEREAVGETLLAAFTEAE